MGHDLESDHVHEADSDLFWLIDALESHTFLSVGIDIGSSTSHLTISRLVIRRRASSMSTEFVVSRREALHASPVWLTPYRPDGDLIDTDRIRRLMEDEYKTAGFAPRDIDTGAIVITGEALKKANAENIARMVADWSGRFVSVSAGPMHEGLLAAHGSGSVALSAAGASTVVNVDIGGGTTKISVVVNGVIEHIESVSIGARLVAFDDAGLIVRWERPATALAGHLGLVRGPGQPMTGPDQSRMAGLMADVLMDIVTGAARVPGLRRELMVATDQKAVPPLADIGHLVFSGGVSEYLEPGASGPGDDLGYLLAAALRERLASAGLIARVHPAAQRIRATVLGASQFSVQASSQTVYVSDAGALPVHGLQAVEIDARGPVDDTTVTASLHRLDLERWSGQLAAVIRLDTPTTHAQLFQAAAALARVAGRSATCPLYIVLRADVARALGRVLKEEIRWTGPVIVVDGIDASSLDHLDIGEPLGYTGALPVTVTSLQFPSARPLPVTTGSPE
jgi:ethanolamine utilization protein EutA